MVIVIRNAWPKAIPLSSAYTVLKLFKLLFQNFDHEQGRSLFQRAAASPAAVHVELHRAGGRKVPTLPVLRLVLPPGDQSYYCDNNTDNINWIRTLTVL